MNPFPKTIKVGGKDWKMPADHETIDIILQFRDWIKEQIGDPFIEAKKVIDLLTDEPERKAVVKEARDIADQLRCFTLSCPLALKWMKSIDGMRHFMFLMLQVNQPDVTLAEALEVGMAAAKSIPGLVPKEDPKGNGKADPKGNVLTPTEQISLIGDTTGTPA